MEKQKSLLAIILLFCLVNLTAAIGAPYQVDEALTDEVHLLPDVSFESDEAGGLPSGWSSIHTDSVAVFDSLCLLYTSPSPRDRQKSRMPSSA